MGKRASSSASAAKTRVTEYRLSTHLGACLEADGLKALYFGEKEAWSGNVTEESVIQIQRPDLHGGISNEGGACGLAFFLPGGRQQVMPEGLAQRMGLTSETCPAYRGLSSVFLVDNPALTIDGGTKSGTSLISTFLSFFSGGVVPRRLLQGFYAAYTALLGASGAQGFYMGANNPYLKTVWAKLWRAPKGLNPSNAMVGDDANFVHIIFEGLTNTSWGMGAPTAILDIANFQDKAATIFDEGLGASFMWTQQTSVETFISEMLDHIQAAFYINPQTGLFSLTLFRGDYVIDDLRIINPSNATVTNFQRKTWGETINELIVTYTDAETEDNATITTADLGNIAMQGQVVSDSRNYYAIRNGETASKLAERDLAAASAPLATCEIELDRTFWDILPGEVLILEWPEYGIEQLVVRVVNIDYGKPDAGTIKIAVMEDIFATTAAEYSTPPDSQHVDPSEDPRQMDFVRIAAVPAYLLTALASLPYPEVTTMVLGAQSGQDTDTFDLYNLGSDSLGNLAYNLIGSRNVVSHATLASMLSAEASSTIEAFDDLVGSTPTIGTYLLIGADSDDDNICELAVVTGITDLGWQVNRGILDTVPRTWAADTPVWIIKPDINITDNLARSDGETVSYKLLARTSRGVLPIDSVTASTDTLSGRPHYPLRPANVSVCGSLFGNANAAAKTTVEVTWSNRNRLSETGLILSWTDGTVPPEDGQTTTVEVRTTGGMVLETYEGLIGSSFNIPLEDFAGNTSAKVRIWSVRDDHESLQFFERNIINIAAAAGYGGAYGISYGS